MRRRSAPPQHPREMSSPPLPTTVSTAGSSRGSLDPDLFERAAAQTRSTGWATLDRSLPFFKTLPLLRALAAERVETSRLKARPRTDARPNTLSSHFGLAAFPPHTDYATRDLPPKYVVLVAPNPRPATTLLFSADQALGALGDAHANALFRVDTGRRAFYSKFLTGCRRRRFVRYNPVLMSPLCAHGRALESYMAGGSSPAATIDWRHTRVAIIDNWRLLHARAHATSSAEPALRRFAIWSTK